MDVPVSAKAALLQALIDGCSFGLELVELVKARTGGRIVLGDASVYPALRALEKEGLLRSWDGDPLPERGGRPRRYYELTSDGLRTARENREMVKGLFLKPVAARTR